MWESKQTQKRSIEEWERLLETNRVGLLETEKQMVQWEMELKSKSSLLQQQEAKIKDWERTLNEKERTLTMKTGTKFSPADYA